MSLLIYLLFPLLIVLSGCQGPDAAASKLFEKGAYEEVIQKYPDSQMARRARAKIAQGLLEKGDYQQVIRNYADTPAAYDAKTKLAQQLFDQKRYSEVISQFPSLPIATSAKNAVADSLYAAGNLDQVLALYPESPRATEIKNSRAQEALDKVKKLRGKAREEGLQDILNKFKGTAPADSASKMLMDIRNTAAKKK